MEVVVVGGGIVGMASAYYLTRRGADVILCEQNRLGNGSTERSVGGIRAQFAHPTDIELSRASLSVWERFAETFGVDIEFRRTGYLFLAREPETADALRESVERQQRHGVPSSYLDPREARDRCPALQVERYAGASFSSSDGFADPHLALQGYIEAAANAGVDIRPNTRVSAIQTRDGAVSGVTVDGDQLSPDFVVNAAGPWAARVADMAGLRLPVVPRRRQVLVVDPTTPVPSTVPLTIDLDTGAYFRPEREGAALVGGHFDESDPPADPDGYRRSYDLAWALTAIEQAAEVARYFDSETELRRGWAGLYAVTPDDRAILEESIPGFVQAVGFSGHGFQHAPATGQLVAELVLDGSTSLLDIDSLRRDRFEYQDLDAEWQVV